MSWPSESHKYVDQFQGEAHNIGKTFVKGRGGGARGIIEVAANPVQDGMGRFVHDDVVGQTGENQLAREVYARLDFGCAKITEEESMLGSIGGRVCPLQGIGINLEQAVKRSSGG